MSDVEDRAFVVTMQLVRSGGELSDERIARACHQDPSLIAAVVRRLMAGRREASPAVSGAFARLGADPGLPLLPSHEPYDDLRFLDRGGMGVVYEARDTELARIVAIKIPDTSAADPAMLAAFAQEARVLARLEHRAIVPVQRMGRLADGRPFFVMRRIHGEKLTRRLEQPLRPHDGSHEDGLLEYFEEICRAVALAHAQQPPILHRDLKPGNIMVSEAEEIFVLDWGIARLVEPGELESGELESGEAVVADRVNDATGDTDGTSRPSTATGVVKGTSGYMAPEQARGENAALTPAADVFALGAILGQILSVRFAYPPGTPAADIEGELGRTYLALGECGADPELIAVALHCLAFRPEDRPADAAHVLAEFQEARGAIQRRLRTAERERAASEARADSEIRRRRVLSAVALCVVALAVLAVAFVRQRATADHERQRLLRSQAGLLSSRSIAARARLARREHLQQLSAIFECSTFTYGSPAANRVTLLEDIQTALSPKQTRVISAPPHGERIPAFSRMMRAVSRAKTTDLLLAVGHDSRIRKLNLVALRDNFEDMERDGISLAKEIVGIDLASDNRSFIAVDAEGWLGLYAIDDGRRIAQPFRPHTESFTPPSFPGLDNDITTYCAAAVLGSDGQLATAGHDGFLRMWELRGSEFVKKWERGGYATASGETVRELIFHRDGQHLWGVYQRRIRRWRLEDGREDDRSIGWSGLDYTVMATSDDGRLLATGTNDGLIQIWNVSGEREQYLNRVQLSPLFGSGEFDMAPETNEPAAERLPLHEMAAFMRRGVTSLAFSPGAKWLAVALGDGSISLIDTRSSQVLHRAIGHLPDEVGMQWVQVTFSSRGNLFSLAQDGVMRQWDLNPLIHGRTILAGDQRSMLHVAASPDGEEWGATNAAGAILRWRVRDGGLIARSNPPELFPVRLAYHPTRRELLFTTRGGTVGVLNRDTGELTHQYRPHEAQSALGSLLRLFGDEAPIRITALAIHPDGEQVATAWHDGSIDVWSLAEGRRVRQLRRDGVRSTSALAYRPDGQELAAGHENGHVSLWDAATFERRGHDQTLAGPQMSNLGSLSYSKQHGRWLLAQTGNRGYVTIWNPGAGTRVTELKGHASVAMPRGIWWHQVRVGAFSPNGRWLATGGMDGFVRIWDGKTLQQVAAISLRSLAPELHEIERTNLDADRLTSIIVQSQEITDLVFDASSRQLFVASFDGVPRVYDLDRVLEFANRSPKVILRELEAIHGVVYRKGLVQVDRERYFANLSNHGKESR